MKRTRRRLAAVSLSSTAAPTSRRTLVPGLGAPRDKRGHDEWIYVMLYAVSAKLIPDRAPEFHTLLKNGSIASQRPDGAEIVAAMKRARAGPDGRCAGPRPAIAPRLSSMNAPPCLTAISPELRQRSLIALRPSTACR